MVCCSAVLCRQRSVCARCSQQHHACPSHAASGDDAYLPGLQEQGSCAPDHVLDMLYLAGRYVAPRLQQGVALQLLGVWRARHCRTPQPRASAAWYRQNLTFMLKLKRSPHAMCMSKFHATLESCWGCLVQHQLSHCCVHCSQYCVRCHK